MRAGQVARIEEITRMPAEVQDALITILSEKTLPVPELGAEVQAVPGFTLVATANDRDRGVNEMSSALKRRFNTVVLPVPESAEAEIEIVSRRVAELGRANGPPSRPRSAEVRRVVQVFRELRSGVTADGRTTLKVADRHAVDRRGDQRAHQRHDPRRALRRRRAPGPADVAAGLVGAVVKDPVHDRVRGTSTWKPSFAERDGLARPVPRVP